MLSDPLSVTYNGNAKSLPRLGSDSPVPGRIVQSRRYATPDGEFEVSTSVLSNDADVTRVEILLTRAAPDNDADPFNGLWRRLPNSVGLVYEVNNLHFNTSTDIPLLRTALLALVDSTLQGRLIGGEF